MFDLICSLPCLGMSIHTFLTLRNICVESTLSVNWIKIMIVGSFVSDTLTCLGLICSLPCLGMSNTHFLLTLSLICVESTLSVNLIKIMIVGSFVSYTLTCHYMYILYRITIGFISSNDQSITSLPNLEVFKIGA